MRDPASELSIKYSEKELWDHLNNTYQSEDLGAYATKHEELAACVRASDYIVSDRRVLTRIQHSNDDRGKWVIQNLFYGYHGLDEFEKKHRDGTAISRASMSLVGKLLFYDHLDLEQTDRLFHMSQLFIKMAQYSMRLNWDSLSEDEELTNGEVLIERMAKQNPKMVFPRYHEFIDPNQYVG